MQINNVQDFANFVSFHEAAYGVVLVIFITITLLLLLTSIANFIDFICGNPLHFTFKKWLGSSSNQMSSGNISNIRAAIRRRTR